MPTVIILGASSGLGFALAQHYITHGWKVGLAARRTQPLEQLRELAPSPERVASACIDVRTPEAPEQLEQLLLQLGGKMDLYLHCAGIGKMTATIRYEEELPMLQTNVTGWTACIDWAYQTLCRQGFGQLAAITSFAANRGLAPAPAYAATKAFQAHYLESLRQRLLAKHLRRITITDLRPGFVDTPLLAHPERLFWVLSTEVAVRAMLRAIDRRRPIATVTTRWALLAPILRFAPRRLLARILSRAL